MPHSTIATARAALLFVDMSGFTPLSEQLSAKGLMGVEELSSHLSAYFGGIIEIVHAHGGDVIKVLIIVVFFWPLLMLLSPFEQFAGDALLVCFASFPGCEFSLSVDGLESPSLETFASR